MQLSQKDLDHVTKLAHIAIKPEKADMYLSQMQDILNYMAILDQMPLDGLEPSAYANDHSHYMRDDQVIDYGELNLEINAPDWENHSFRVPQMKSEPSA